MRSYSIKFLSAVIIFMICIINLAVISIYTYEKLKLSIEAKYNEKSILLLTQTFKHINEKMKTSENIIRLLAGLEEIKSPAVNPGIKIKMLTDHMEIFSGIKSLNFAGTDGAFVSNLSSIRPKDYTPSSEIWYKNALRNSGIPVWTDPFLDYNDQHIVFSVSVSVHEKTGKATGVICAIFEVSGLSSLLKVNELGDTGYMMLLSSKGIVIANRDNYFIGENILKEKFNEIGSSDNITKLNFDINGAKYDVNALKLGANGMSLVTLVNQNEIRNVLLKEYLRIFLVEFSVIILFSALFYLLVRKSIAPLNELSDLMSEAENGNYSVRAESNQYKEIRILARQFNNMIERIQNRDELLKHREIRIMNLAYYDSLTGLPNRIYLINAINEAIESLKNPPSEKPNTGGALLYIDLDGFKTINDTMGHSAGDSVLKEIASRLKHNLRYKQVAARLGGDEFVILIEDIESVDAVRKASRRILNIVNIPIKIGNTRHEISASMGIVLYPSQGDQADVLLKKGDIAMYKAKKNGKNNYQLFEENLEKEILNRSLIENEISRSIKEKLFYVQYQPLFDFSSGNICGFEALLRTDNEKLAHFEIIELIRVAEETGMIVQIEKLIFSQSFRFITELNRQFKTELSVSVNVSSTHIKQEKFIETVLNEIRESGARLSYINIEITETAIMDSVKEGTEKIKELRESGIGIHLDDFGTGYSSLSYLQNLPINRVKIDKSFVESMEFDEKERNIISLIIEIAHNLELTVVAEGIETEKQFHYLRNFNCDIAQGYYLQKPMSRDDIYLLINKSTVLDILS